MMAIVSKYTRLWRLMVMGACVAFWPAISRSMPAEMPDDNQCINCHLELAGELQIPSDNFPEDIHAQRGLFCQDCHGGDPTQVDKTAAKLSGTGYTGKPDHRQIPERCNSCHGDEDYMKRYNPNIRVDQYDRYLTSVHGQRLLEGDTRVAVCTSCHQVHQVRSSQNILARTFPTNVAETCGHCHADAEYMAGYDITVTQSEDYEQSIHYDFLMNQGDLTAPTCNDCHGNHGAVPPGVQSVHFVCGTCHASNEVQFQGSTHAEYFDMLEMPGCITCHNNHSTNRVEEEWLDLDSGESCSTCHDADSESGENILQIKAALDTFRVNLERVDSLVHLVETKGMEVSEAKFQLTQARTTLTKSRNSVHSFDWETVQSNTSAGMTLVGEALTEGNNALHEILVRRIGLVISLIFIILLGIGLFLKIREIGIPSSES
jgi:hypothetical protein